MCLFVLFGVKWHVRMICLMGLPILDSSYIDSPDTRQLAHLSALGRQSQRATGRRATTPDSCTHRIHHQGAGSSHPNSHLSNPTFHFFEHESFYFGNFQAYKKVQGWRCSPAGRGFAQHPQGLRLHPRHPKAGCGIHAYCRGSQVPGEHGVQIKLKVTLN